MPFSELDAIVRRVRFRPAGAHPLEEADSREWIVTNGLGGYSCGTVQGALTRRFHGLLVAAFPSPLGRTMMLAHVLERVVGSDQQRHWLGIPQDRGHLTQESAGEYLTEFRLEAGMPVWRNELPGAVIEKRIVMPHGQNTVHVTYELVEGKEPVRLMLRPVVGFRPHEAPVDRIPTEGYTVSVSDERIEVTGDETIPPLRLALHAHSGTFRLDGRAVRDVGYLVEARRGYDSSGPLWTPGQFQAVLGLDSPVTLIASAEPWSTVAALNPPDARVMERTRRRRVLQAAPASLRSGPGAELVLAADQFLIAPISRPADGVRALAMGGQARTVIAGYHWFTDWGRDTMIALEGLTLVTGRYNEARDILRTFAYHIRDGLIPNMFPEGGNDGLYHTADATLWFFHALDRYVQHTGDLSLVHGLLPKLREIVEAHRAGTRFGIGVDPDDGLLRQGAEGYQLTWMDAKVADWVVTPRRGKAVEINALWYNALQLLAHWLRGRGHVRDAKAIEREATRVHRSFNRRFPRTDAASLFDVVDGEHGDDPACRPNQLLAISLRFPVLEQERWAGLLDEVRDKLLTPVGLRSLSRDHPDYQPQYFGDLRARDAAYHQGTVWAWLIGPYVDAWLAAHPRDEAAMHEQLALMLPALDRACIGSISEVFDAEEPHSPRGCVAQAWSIAELLRVWAKTMPPAEDTKS